MNYSEKNIIHRQKEMNSTGKKLQSKTGVSFFRIFLLCVVAVIVAGLCAGFGIIRGILDGTPDISTIDVSPTGFASTVYDAQGTQIQKLVGSDANRIYVELSQIPPDVYNAFIAIEDKRFKEHNGIDVEGILRAVFNGIRKGDFDSGASTLTQQLIKNQVFEGGQEVEFVDKVKRKLREQYLAVQLEKNLSKDQILEYYLNTINLGQNTLGVQAASLRYFNKDIWDLTLSEATVIAGITQNPSYYNPITYPEHNKEKREIILTYMVEQEYITEEEKAEAMADQVYDRILEVNNVIYSDANATVNSYFVDATIDEVMEDLQKELGYTSTQATNMIYRNGLEIFTTQDPEIQEICDTVTSNSDYFPSGSVLELTYALSVMHEDGSQTNYSEGHLKEFMLENNLGKNLYYTKKSQADELLEAFKKSVVDEAANDKVIGEKATFTWQPQISFTILDQHTGYVKAIVGGRGKKTGSRTLNRATNTVRQPGSTFKVLAVYVPALDSCGMSLATTYVDEEHYYPNGKKVNNWETNTYRGITTLREAITRSMNIVTVKVFEDVTPQVGYNYLLKMGFTTLVESRSDDKGDIYSDITLATALGGLTDGVTNLELTSAYASIANGGVYESPTFYTKVVDRDGNIILDHTKPQGTRVMKETTAWLLTSAMEDVIKSSIGTGRLARFQNIDMAEAGKTGTTSNKYDVWFAGFTPYYTAAIWSGYDHNVKQSDVNYHKTIWRVIMEKVHQKKNLETADFTMPDGISKATICGSCGCKASELCKSAGDAHTEYFATSSTSNKTCSCHISLTICDESGKIANEYCPKTHQEVFSSTRTDTLNPNNPEDICTEHDATTVIQDVPTDGTPDGGDTNGDLLEIN